VGSRIVRPTPGMEGSMLWMSANRNYTAGPVGTCNGLNGGCIKIFSGCPGFAPTEQGYTILLMLQTFGSYGAYSENAILCIWSSLQPFPEKTKIPPLDFCQALFLLNIIGNRSPAIVLLPPLNTILIFLNVKQP